MATDNEKTLYTLQSQLHSQVMVLGSMVLERLAQLTNQDADSLHEEWRERSREQFREVTQRVLEHPDLLSPIPALTMLEMSEWMWKKEDEMRSQSEPKDR